MGYDLQGRAKGNVSPLGHHIDHLDSLAGDQARAIAVHTEGSPMWDERGKGGESTRPQLHRLRAPNKIHKTRQKGIKAALPSYPSKKDSGESRNDSSR